MENGYIWSSSFYNSFDKENKEELLWNIPSHRRYFILIMKILKKIFEGDAHHDLKVVQQIKISLKNA